MIATSLKSLKAFISRLQQPRALKAKAGRRSQKQWPRWWTAFDGSCRYVAACKAPPDLTHNAPATPYRLDLYALGRRHCLCCSRNSLMRNELVGRPVFCGLGQRPVSRTRSRDTSLIGSSAIQHPVVEVLLINWRTCRSIYPLSLGSPSVL